MTNKVDRRTVRTKKEIKETFISLLEEISFEKVSVRDLTERANINRGTFYLHYLDKYDLLEKLEEELFEKVQAIIDETAFSDHMDIVDFTVERFPFLVRLLRCFQEEAALMKVLISPNGDANFKEKIRHVFLYNLEGMIPLVSKAEQLHYPLDLLIAYISSAHLGVLSYWLEHDLEQSPEEIAALLVDMASKGPLVASGMDKMIIKGQHQNHTHI